MRALLCAACLVVPIRAGEPAGLVALGVNEEGAEEWLRTRDGAVVVRVPRGDYRRRPYEGGEATEEPRPVFVESFFIDKHEVTNAQFARFLDDAPKADALVRPGLGLERTADGWRPAAGKGRHPCTAATGHGALAYARWAGGALPTAEQWEKAAGGAEGRMFPWGDAEPDATRANFGRPALRGPMPVGSFPAGASPYGCLDMAGNAYERVLVRRGTGEALPVMIKGGSWLSPHPLNLRVLDLCMQPMEVAERSVGFRCVMADPEPERPVREASPAPALKLARDWEEAVKEARERRVPLFLSLQFDTCGQCDRTRAQLFRDPRFVAYCNERLVVAVGHRAAPQPGVDDHPENGDGSCPLYPGLTCTDHHAVFNRAIHIVGVFRVSPGNFVLHPDRCEAGAGPKAILVPEADLPKWGDAVEEYLAAFERARKAME